MEFERAGLEILLKEIPYNSVSLVLKDGKDLQTYNNLNKTLFIQYASRKFNGYSQNEVENIFDYLTNRDGKTVNLFEIVENVADKFLRFKGGEICYCLEEALRWREVSFQLGSDIFVAAFVASMYDAYILPKCYWKATIVSCKRYEGLAENHFHLQGSTKIFDVNWIALMNKVLERQTIFMQMHYTLDRKLEGASGREESFEEKCYKAALYRVYLYSVMSNRTELEKRCREIIEETEYSHGIENNLSELQDIICCCKIERQKSGEDEFIELDYAILREEVGNNLYDNLFVIDKNNSDEMKMDYRLLLGERYFLTECFRRVQANAGVESFNSFQCNVFYRYLIIKNLFRSELIQTNYAVGFKNFANYQDRKKYFIKGNSIFEHEMIKLAINVTANEQNLTSLEARICPEKNANKLEQRIRKYQSIFYDGVTSKDTDLYFVLHFPKYEDSPFVPGFSRHYKLRNEMRKTTNMLKSFFEERTEINAYVRGIDACANEIGCRPEVFAPYFRELLDLRFESLEPGHGSSQKNNQVNCQKEHFIKATYHVGEDFLDIVDGLRAIDEAITFCGLKKGDRLGHALALGIMPLQYYELKRNTICLSKQDLLDNLIWMYKKIYDFKLESDTRVKEFLTNDLSKMDKEGIKSKINSLLKELYPFLQTKLTTLDERIESYVKAWELRGDVPTNYLNVETLNADIAKEVKHKYDFNSWIKTNNIRNILKCLDVEQNAIQIYHDYHFNETTRKFGMVKTDFKITKRYAYVVELLQNEMMREICTKEIAIETNPSSNFLIGTINRYDEHPILRFNSTGLNPMQSQYNLSVSINTDDQGVFDTSLENEYTIMYAALSKAQNEDGSLKYTGVDDWINNIIEQGNSQAFKFEEMEAKITVQ